MNKTTPHPFWRRYRVHIVLALAALFAIGLAAEAQHGQPPHICHLADEWCQP